MLLFSIYIAHQASAAVTDYTSKSEWEAAAGAYTTIDFTGYTSGTIITNQYASPGVIFTEGNDRINDSIAFLNDGWGLNGSFDTFTLSFSQPMRTVACDFPGHLQIKLYYQGTLIHTNPFWFGGSTSASFGGMISDQPFDRAVVLDPLGDVFVDDLHFGQGIPAPGVLPLLGLALLASRRKRR